MVTIVLNASARLRPFLRQGGADRVLELLELGQLHTARIVISAVKLGYADAFCVELAASIPGAKLITADFDFLKVIDLTSIEFLPKNPLPAVQP